MKMGHTPYGYKIENGKAVIDNEAVTKIQNLYGAYLAGASLQKAANDAGIDVKHCGAKRIMEIVIISATASIRPSLTKKPSNRPKPKSSVGQKRSDG